MSDDKSEKTVFDDISNVIEYMREDEIDKFMEILKQHRKTIAQKSNGEQT